jgi:hypothetical protein
MGKYCNEMDACNREIECVLKEKIFPILYLSKRLVEIQEERLIA